MRFGYICTKDYQPSHSSSELLSFVVTFLLVAVSLNGVLDRIVFRDVEELTLLTDKPDAGDALRELKGLFCCCCCC